MAITITDSESNLIITSGTQEFFLTKTGTSINANGEYIYFNGYEIKNYRLKYSEITSPVSTDINDLVDIIDGYLDSVGSGSSSFEDLTGNPEDNEALESYIEESIQDGANNNILVWKDEFDRASLGIGSTYTQIGATASFGITSNKLVVSGGVGTYVQALDYNLLTEAENYEFTVDDLVNTTASATSGIGISIHTVNAALSGAALIGTMGFIDLSNTATRGKLTIYSNANGTVTSLADSGSELLSFLDTESLRLTFRRNLLNAIFIATNTDTGDSVSITYALSSQALFAFSRIGKPRIHAFGGTQTIGELSFHLNEPVNPKFMIKHDSIGEGYGVTLVNKRYAAILANRLKGGVVNLSKPSSSTLDYAGTDHEAALIKPKYTLLMRGVNDAILGYTVGDFTTRLNAEIEACRATGSIPILVTIAPTTNAGYNTTIVSYNAVINAIANVRIIDLYTTMASAGVLNSLYSYDGIHWTNEGHRVASNVILNAIVDLDNQTPNNMPTQFSVGVEPTNYTAVTNRTIFSVCGSTQTTPIPVSSQCHTFGATLDIALRGHNVFLNDSNTITRVNTGFGGFREQSNAGTTNPGITVNWALVKANGSVTDTMGIAMDASGNEYLYLGAGTLRVGVGTGSTTRPSAQHHVVSTTLGGEVQRLESVATNDDPSIRVYQNRLATINDTLTTIHTVAIPSSTTVLLHGFVVARRTGGTAGTAEDGAAYEFKAAIKNVSGTATLIGSATVTVIGEDQAGWDCQVNVSSSNGLIQVKGATDNNITWHLSKMELMQVGS